MIPILGKIADSFSAAFNFLNRKDSPTSKATVTGSPNSPIIQTGRVQGGVHQTNVFGATHRTRPSIDIRNDGHSGGPHGNEVFFAIKNDGQESARNIRLQFMDGERLIKAEQIQNLTANEGTRVSYRYTDTVYFLEQLSDPKLIVSYNSVDGRQFESGVGLIQEKRADGRYNLSTKLGGSFDRTLP